MKEENEPEPEKEEEEEEEGQEEDQDDEDEEEKDPEPQKHETMVRFPDGSRGFIDKKVLGDLKAEHKGDELTEKKRVYVHQWVKPPKKEE
ncbi:MAG: hypothetical protein ACE5JI_17740 [Acidobacteriota bacterium]